jgi:hypothetical protein
MHHSERSSTCELLNWQFLVLNSRLAQPTVGARRTGKSGSHSQVCRSWSQNTFSRFMLHDLSHASPKSCPAPPAIKAQTIFIVLGDSGRCARPEGSEPVNI